MCLKIMGRKVNPTAFRLGLVTFWKSELYSQNFSNIFKNFLDFYRLLKISLRVFGLELLSSKIVGLGDSRFMVLANFYRYALYKKKKKKWFKRKLKKKSKKSLKKKLKKKVKKWVVKKSLKQKRKARKSRWLKWTTFKIKKKFALKEAVMSLEYFFSILLKKMVFVKLRSIFDVKNNRRSKFQNGMDSELLEQGYLNKRFSPLTLSKRVYKKMKLFNKARFFEFLRDTVNVVNFSFLFVDSSIFSYYLGKLIKFHRNIKYVVYKVKTIIEGFRLFHLDHSSIRVSVFGKIKGVSRTSSITFSCGSHWPLQTPTARLDYNLTQTWNVFGAYGIKVWIFNYMKG